MEIARTRNGVTVGGYCQNCDGTWYVVNGLCEDCAVALDPGPPPSLDYLRNYALGRADALSGDLDDITRENDPGYTDGYRSV